MIVVDSFSMLNTVKELEDAKKIKSAADMGLRAKEGISSGIGIGIKDIEPLSRILRQKRITEF